DEKILSQVLNNYDRITKDFYRWKVEYTQDELTKLIKEKSEIDFGNIIDLVPIERGHSGRLIKLKVVGTKKTLTIGKELEIRKLLSASHLYSSAFIIEKENIVDNIPQKIILTGAGWGHGVGLCQIGAAVMGEKGYQFDEILLHYFRDAQIKKIY
ncbi:MAG: amidase, partial [Ignavibacteriales bacterium]|nr:amidase [Ignavibacteriales bacterium]